LESICREVDRLISKEMTFYYGLDGSGADRSIDAENIFISAATLWSEGKQDFKEWTPPQHSNFMLDCGGFSFFNQFESKEYPFGPEELADLARNLSPDYVATIDYPCEPTLLKEKGWGVQENIRRTVKNAERCMEINVDSTWLPVIQGFKLSEYKTCIDMMENRGLIRDFMAVGSVCVRGKISNIRRIVIGIDKYLQSKGYNVKLHYFGLSLNAIKDFDCFLRINSTDSGAWKWDQSDESKKYPSNQEEKLENFESYKERVSNCLNQHNQREILEEYL